LAAKADELIKTIRQGKDDGVLSELTRTAHLLELKDSSYSLSDTIELIKFWFPSPGNFLDDTEEDESLENDEEEWGDGLEDESLENDEEEWGDGLVALNDLVVLATEAGKQAAQRKKPANGAREDYQSPMNSLLREIGIDIRLSKSPTSHAVPIAKAIHIWASGENNLAPNWGVASWRTILKQLKAEPEKFWDDLRKKP
jgi:hypothetical protein